MKKLIILTLLIVSVKTPALAATLNGDQGSDKAGWQDFFIEFKQQVKRHIEEARVEAEKRPGRGLQALRQYPSGGARNRFKPAAPQSPQQLVDRSTLLWLSSALKRPIPEEAALRAIFRKERVPEDLIYVGLVESGYRRDAVSNAGAVGPWQFIRETGRRYGLRQGKNGDERRDLLKSTGAAARYLRDLYDLLGDWTLALAGYNAGENRVLRAMQKADTTDFWSLRHLLPAETAEYVPRVVAAIFLAGKRAAGGAKPRASN